jgi:uncharacterized Zn-binding protein involved in type VI secretion
MVTPVGPVPVPHVGGPILTSLAPNILVNGIPVATIGSMCLCVGPPDIITMGEPTILANGIPVATVGSPTAHGGMVAMGMANILRI